MRSCGGRPCVPGWTNPSPRTPSASPPQARSCGTLRPPRSVTSTLRETSIKGAPNRIVCETRTQAGFQSSRAQNRHLALCVYVKRSCSNCRCYVNVLAESWKIIHSCAYMRPGAMPSIRHVRRTGALRGLGSAWSGRTGAQEDRICVSGSLVFIKPGFAGLRSGSWSRLVRWIAC